MSTRLGASPRAAALACLLLAQCTHAEAVTDAAMLADAGPPDAAAIDARASDTGHEAGRSEVDAAASLDDAFVIAPDAGADDAAIDVLDAGSTCPAGMRFIPAGSFLMGDPSADDMPSQPVHGVSVSAFCIDRLEVTVGGYEACAACSTPDSGRACNYGVAGREGHPINCIDWTQARAYCQWRGSDLPTEAQWEYAARGSDGRTYPWGDDAPAAQLCWSGVSARTSTCNVGSFPAGASPFGVEDMAGNVWEWTLDWYGAYTGDASRYAMDPTGVASGISRVNRGGSWGNALEIDVRPMIRFGGRPTRRLESLGFRCASPPS